MKLQNSLAYRTLLTSLLLGLLLHANLHATPPAEVEWQLVPELSDEFDTPYPNRQDDGIDPTKWWDFYPSWKGRLPSQFSAKNTWLDGGKLNLRSTATVSDMSEVTNPEKDHWVDAPVIVSRAEAQPGDYFEASIKTASLSMPSSWWFCQGAKSEIDVLENIGLPSAPNLAHRETEMAYNTHYSDPGDDQAEGGEAQMVDDDGRPLRSRENFVTYGLWWKSPTELRFYYNDRKVAIITPAGPFDEGLNMVFDMEVFPWVGLPTLESLADPTKNTMQVDWVRTYRPVENTAPKNQVDNPGFEVSHPGQPVRPDLWADCGKFDGCGDAEPFESRSNAEAHSGEWSLRIDNTRANSFEQFKEIAARDNVYSVLPGETIHHQLWVKLTQPWPTGRATLGVGIRLNGDPQEARTGVGRALREDGKTIEIYGDMESRVREHFLNATFGGANFQQWVLVEHVLEIPATDIQGRPVEYVSMIVYMNNQDATTPVGGELFIDDVSLEVLPPRLKGDIDGDGDVDGADFLELQRGRTPLTLGEGMLKEWKANYGN